MSHLGGVVSKLVQLKRIIEGDFGADPPAAGDHRDLERPLGNFSAKNNHFDHISDVFKDI